MIKDLKRYFSLFFQYFKGKWLIIFLGVILGIISELCMLASPLISKFIIDFVITQKNYNYLNYILLLAGLILIIFLFSSLISNYLFVNLYKRISVKFKMNIFEKLQYAPPEFYEKEQIGGITFRLYGDTENVINSWNQILITLPLQLILLISAIFMLNWNRELSIFVFIVLVFQIIIIVEFREPLLKYSQIVRKKGQEVNGFTVEHFRKIQLVKTLSTEKFEQKNFYQKLNDLVKIEIKAFMISKYSDIFITLISNFWSLGILWYGGRLVIYGKMSLGTLMAFMMFTGLLYRPISSITNFFLSFQSVRASLMRLLEYLEIKPNVIDIENAIDFIPEIGRIQIENLSFNYGEKRVLNNINLVIEPNSITAIVGPSGSGKTTLAKLLVRYYDPLEGKILLDGKDIREIKISFLRKSILLILQNIYVFNGTILENLIYGKEVFDKNKIFNSIEEAHLDFISKLPYGLNTIIGEGGSNISAGEAQRIALARAFLISPKILILDEPTSFIDNKTEDKIKKTLINLKKKMTIIIIAHRLSTVKIADKIVFIEDGKIKEIGIHEELIKINGSYRKMYSSILLGEGV